VTAPFVETSLLTRLVLVALAVAVLNLPFGYWRQGTKKFSPAWFAFVHLPIPFVVLLRLKSGIGFGWYTYPVMVAAYFGGQFLGARHRRRTTGLGSA
jgi:hypothetical protein